MGTGRSTACEVVNGVCEAIRSLLLTRYQLSKKGEPVQNIMNEFENRTDFPKVTEQ